MCYVKVILWKCTAHNKMAAVKKEHLSNIIKVKFTEEKSYWNFCLRFFSCRGETQCVGNVLTEPVRARVAELDFPTENLDSGC